MGDEVTDRVNEQLSLVRAMAAPPGRSTGCRGSRALPAVQVAEVDPVALVLVDVGLPHLDRPFEYLVPASLADLALPGARVRVRFAGQDVDGYLLARAATAEHEGTLAPLRKVVSPEAVLTPQVLALSREMSSRYAGTLGDVVRLAVPPRHATAEKNLPQEAPSGPASGASPGAPEPGPWASYPAGVPFLRHLASGDAPAASWLALPGQQGTADWPVALAVAAGTSLAAGRGALIVVPDHRDVDRVDHALGLLLGAGQHVRLTSGQGPQARYTAWLTVRRGNEGGDVRTGPRPGPGGLVGRRRRRARRAARPLPPCPRGVAGPSQARGCCAVDRWFHQDDLGSAMGRVGSGAVSLRRPGHPQVGCAAGDR